MKVATPLELATWVAEGWMVDAPPLATSLRVSPTSGLPFASNAVIVMVEVADPVAAANVGLATTVEVATDAGPATKATVAVWVSWRAGCWSRCRSPSGPRGP